MKFLCGARTVLYLHGWWSCKIYCQKEQASNSDLCRTFPKGSHYLITCIFILHLLFTVYLLNFDPQCRPLGLEGLRQYSLFTQRGNSTWVVILMDRWRIPWLLEFSADAFLTIPPLNKTQPWQSRRTWALIRRASLGSEDVGPETPGISSSNRILILWPEVVKHLEGTLGLNFSSSQPELYSYCFCICKTYDSFLKGKDVNSYQTVSHIIFYLYSSNSCGIIPPFLLHLSEIPNEKLSDLGGLQ